MSQDECISRQEYVIAKDDVLVSRTDLDGRITGCNSAFAAASGYPVEELLGRRHDEFDDPESPPEARCSRWGALVASATSTTLIKSRRKNGQVYWVRCTVAPLLQAQRCVGYLIVRTRALRRQVHAAEAHTRARNGRTTGACANEGGA